MKPNVRTTFSLRGFARAVSLPLFVLTVLSLPGLLQAQTLLHHYKFISDASDSVGGSAWNGTIVAPTSGQAASISDGLVLPGNSGSGYVSLPNGIVKGDTNITVECWLAPSGSPGNTWAEIWDFGSSGSINFALIQDSPNPNGQMRVAFTPNGGEDDIHAPAPLEVGTGPQYIVVTYNNSTLTADLYTNAVLDGTTVLPNTSYSPGTYGGANGTTENALGNDVYNDPQFSGTIYDVRIWNGVVPQRYISATAILGYSNVLTNLTVTSASLTLASNTIVETAGELATLNVQIAATGTNALLATADATNWTSSNPNIIQVNSNGVITGIAPGSAKVTAIIDGISTTTASITVIPQALAHRYSFVTDASDSVGGSAWDGTLVGPSTGAAASISNGLVLPGSTVAGNGVSGYVSLPSGILLGDSSITVECWATETSHNTWAELWDFGNNGNQNFALIPYSGSGNTRGAFDPNNGEDDINSAPIATNTEEYIALTYNNYTLAGNLYTNGVLAGSTTYPSIAYSPGILGGAAGTALNALGNDVYGDEQFAGTVYEFRIWNGALSPTYVALAKAAGPAVIVTNTTPTSLALTVNSTNLIGAETEQATVTGNFSVASGVNVTGGATNWTSSNPSILTVSSSGLITALNGGTATVSATVSGVSATSQTITVALTPPEITQEPVGAITAESQSATLSVTAVGGNLTYQWSVNSVAIPGATNSTLVLTNLSISESGNYTVLITNALGFTNSTPVTLSVQQAVLEHRYSFITNAADSVGGPAWNGTLVAPNGGAAATISNGLVLPGNSGGSNGVSGYVSLPTGIVAGYNSVSVDCWVAPSSVNTWAEIWDFGSSTSVNFALIQDSPGPGNMRVAFTPNGGEVDIMAPTYLPINPVPQYITVTYNDETLTADLYTNGVLYATTTLPTNTYSPGLYGGAGGTTENYFGNDVYGDPQFGGTIYEVRVWNGVVPQRYIAAATLLGYSNVVTSLAPTTASIEVASTNLPAEGAEQATVTVQLAQTGTNVIVATQDVTNWTTSNPSILTVNSNGLIMAVNGGTAIVGATIDGVTATVSITVPFAAPTITEEPPATAEILEGGTLHASLENIGIEPYSYHWYFNNSATPISGQSTATLTLLDIQPNDAGSYTAIISNAYGSVTSTPTVLTVVTPTPYEENLLALDPLGYWPLNETTGTVAYDLANGYNGTYVGNVTLGQTGPPNAGFGSPNFGAAFDGTTAYVDIPEGPFNLTGPVTAMAWVQLEAYPGFDGLIGHGDTSWRISINPNGEPGANDGNLGSGDATSGTGIVDGAWHLVAYSYDGNTGQANNGVLYVDGVEVASDSIAATPRGNTLDVWIGGAPDYAAARLLPANIADAAIFAEALSAAEIQALYTNQTILGTTRSGNSLTLTWTSGSLLQAPTILGPWTTNTTAVSPFTVLMTNKSEFYKIQIP